MSNSPAILSINYFRSLRARRGIGRQYAICLKRCSESLHASIYLRPQKVIAISIGASVTYSANANEIQCTPTVIGGETIEIHGVWNRLGAIDAPENSHLCLDAARNRSHCDQKLAIRLEDLIRGYVMTCGLTPQNTKLRCASSSLQSRIQTSQII